MRKQVLNNKELRVDKTLLPFVLVDAQLSDSDLYFQPRPEPSTNATLEPNSFFFLKEQLPFIEPSISRLIFYLDYLTDVRKLYISPSMAPKILATAYRKSYLGFLHCYEIISRFLFI